MIEEFIRYGSDTREAGVSFKDGNWGMLPKKADASEPSLFFFFFLRQMGSAHMFYFKAYFFKFSNKFWLSFVLVYIAIPYSF